MIKGDPRLSQLVSGFHETLRIAGPISQFYIPSLIFPMDGRLQHGYDTPDRTGW
jgi:hypothetical protein